MGDFNQSGIISDLKKYRGTLEDLEDSLCEYAKNTRVALVLPAAYREFDGDAEEKPVYRIIDALKGIPPYISEIVMPIGQANENQFRKAKEAMSVLKTPEREVSLIWIEGRNIQGILERITREVKSVGEGKKGQGQWLSDGLIIGRGESNYIVHHDCDIRTYERKMLANLVQPALCPDMNFEYGTGYYPRIDENNEMKGRLTRLLAKPLLTALKIKARQHSPNDKAYNYLDFLLDHKYIFSGEGFKSIDFAEKQRTTDDYDLEIAEKKEAFDKLSMKTICQKDISDVFDHHHQPMSAGKGESGLEGMTKKIVPALYGDLMSYGMELNKENLRVVEQMYRAIGQDFIRKYWADAISSGLNYDRPGEEAAIELISEWLEDVRKGMFIEHTTKRSETIPNWERVHSAMPKVYDDIIEAVHQDGKL